MLPPPNAQTLLIMSSLAMFTGQLSTRQCSQFRRGMLKLLGPPPENIAVLGHAGVDLEKEWGRATHGLIRACERCPRRLACKKPLT